MKVLLDTHILIWVLQDDERLSEKARSIISGYGNEVFYSTISVWEAQIKYLKKVDGFFLSGGQLNQLSRKSGFSCLPVYPEHAIALSSLSYSPNAPRLHKDPFDRILICQAKTENMLFLTHDSLIPYYNEACTVSV